MSRGISPSVLLAMREPDLAEEIARHTDELGWPPARAVSSIDGLLEAVSGASFDVVVVSDTTARELLRHQHHIRGPRVVVVAREERVESLRAALTLGAKGLVVWPHHRRDLKALVESGMATRTSSPSNLAPLTAVWSPKGGAGASVIAAHLAAAIARTGVSVVLADLALDQADQSTILGADAESKTVIDLLRVVDEIDADVLRTVAWRHSMGFDAVLAPGAPGDQDLVKVSDLVKMIAAVRRLRGHVVVDLPSGYGELAVTMAEEASKVLLVTTPSLLSLKRTRDLIRTLKAGGMDMAKVEVIANNFALGDVTASDIEAITGRAMLAKIKPDIGLHRAPGRGELSEKAVRLLSEPARKLTGKP